MNIAKSSLNYLLQHKKILLIIIVIFAVLIWFIFPKENTKIETVKVKKDNITQTVSASGTINSTTTVNLSFLTSGKLTYVGVKQGDTVTAGQTIATLDQRTARENLEQVLLDYSKQRNTFNATEEDNQNRKPQEALNNEMKRILENNQYDLNKTINSVELQQLIIEQSILTSPINGIVTRADVQVAGVTATPTTIFTVADPENLIFQVDADEADIGKIVLGQKMNVNMDAYPNTNLPLIVTKIDFASHQSDIGGTVYTVEAKLPLNSNNRYRLGMNGDGEIIVAEKQNTLVIPLSSLIDENHVYVQKAKTFEKRTIKTGLQSDIETEIIKGLKAGEEVVMQPDQVASILNKR